MTEYELSNLMLTNFIANSVPAIATFMVVIGAYLMVAWLIGRQLTRSQVTLINALFVVFSLLTILSWFTRFEMAFYYQSELLLLNPDTPVFLEQHTAIGAIIVFMLFIIGALKFMWDIRHPGTDDD